MEQLISLVSKDNVKALEVNKVLNLVESSYKENSSRDLNTNKVLDLIESLKEDSSISLKLGFIQSFTLDMKTLLKDQK